VAIVGLTAAVAVQTKRLHTAQAEVVQIQAKFALFVEQTRQLGEAQIAKNKETEAKNAQKISSALSARNDAISKLRQSLASPRAGFVSGDTGASAGNSNVCFERQALDAALRRLDSGVSQIIGSGDQAVIDAISLLQAWPK
jgi:hypothetical protein